MKLADIETLIWLIVGAIVLLAKGWSKLQGQIDKDSSASDNVPPVERPKPLRPRPQPRAAPVGARPVAAPIPRGAQPVPRTATRSAPTSVRTSPPGDRWQVDPEQIRRFMEQLSGQARPTPTPPITQPPVPKAAAPTRPPPPPPPTPAPTAAEPEPAMAEAAPAAAPTQPVTAAAPAPSTPSRASQWADALRDRQNIRNIIISYEIIGPPKAL